MPKGSKGEERRDATIRAVWASIARHGVSRTTIDGVARVAGFSKGVIHYYFESKKALLLAAFKAYLESYDLEILASLGALGRQPDGKEILGAIIASTLPPFSLEDVEEAELSVLGAGEALTPRYKARLFVQFFPLAMGDRDFAVTLKESYDRQGAAMAECFASLAPESSPEARVAAAASLMALIDGFSLHRVIGYRPEGLAEHAEHAELAQRLMKTLGEALAKR